MAVGGLKVAWQLNEVAALYESAVREALAAFGRENVFIEQYLDRPRHFGSTNHCRSAGNVVVVGTRDCSLQRPSIKVSGRSTCTILLMSKFHTNSFNLQFADLPSC